ncbi:MAG: PA2169 family four-helix-bundle protein [Bacteroidia bacterium]|nr:PA2169 family four-helix-bundle protein [Bacteroidia bacterium]
MNNDIKKTEATLKRILDICHDGAVGYEQAANYMEDKTLKTTFLRLSQQRRFFIEDLRQDARDLGIDPDASGTHAGYFHRLWINIRSAFSSRSLRDIIQESERGEENAIETYDEVLKHPEVPLYIKEKLNRQKDLIRQVAIQLSELDNELAKVEKRNA